MNLESFLLILEGGLTVKLSSLLLYICYTFTIAKFNVSFKVFALVMEFLRKTAVWQQLKGFGSLDEALPYFA